jgi:DNA-binding CsgD family transcriptional regulator
VNGERTAASLNGTREAKAVRSRAGRKARPPAVSGRAPPEPAAPAWACAAQGPRKPRPSNTPSSLRRLLDAGPRPLGRDLSETSSASQYERVSTRSQDSGLAAAGRKVGYSARPGGILPGMMLARAGLEPQLNQVMHAAFAAHATARTECLRAIRAARRATLEQQAAAVSRLRRNSQRASLTTEAERRLGRLRPRELEVMLLLAAGLHTNEVAHALFITKETVRTHVKQALQHCRAHSRGEVFRLLELAHDTGQVRLATRRVQPFLDQWWSRKAERDDGLISSPPSSSRA